MYCGYQDAFDTFRQGERSNTLYNEFIAWIRDTIKPGWFVTINPNKPMTHMQMRIFTSRVIKKIDEFHLGKGYRRKPEKRLFGIGFIEDGTTRSHNGSRIASRHCHLLVRPLWSLSSPTQNKRLGIISDNYFCKWACPSSSMLIQEIDQDLERTIAYTIKDAWKGNYSDFILTTDFH